MNLRILRRFLSLCLFAVACCGPGRADPWTVRIAFGSCTDEPDSRIWDAIRAVEPSVLLMLGDNIYLQDPEWQKIDVVMGRYRALFASRGFSALSRAVPVYAIWDDHDFGPNNSDRYFPFRDVTFRAFRKAWTNNPKPPASLAGSIAFAVTLGPVEILMTDNRTYREEPPGGTMFGAMQGEWIRKRLRETTAEVAVVAGGNQWLTQSRAGLLSEKLQAFPVERQALLSAIRDSPATVVLLSGDRHYGEILREDVDGRPVLEGSSSPLTAKPRVFDSEEKREIGPNSLGVVSDVNNFGVLTLTRNSEGLNVAVSLKDAGGHELAHHREVYRPRGSK